MATETKTIIIAIFCIVVSALISGIFVYSRFHQTTAPLLTTNTVNTINTITPNPTTSLSSIIVSTSPAKNISPVTVDSADIEKAMDTLDNFNKYLNDGEYDKAVELFDWDSFPDLASAFTGYYVPGNKAKTFENICKNPDYCLRFHKILKTRKVSDTDYWFTIQYQTKDGQIFVNSTHVSGTFVKNTDFLYQVKKRNGVFKVAELPNGFNVEAE